MTRKLDAMPKAFLDEYLLDNADYYTAHGVSSHDASAEAQDIWDSMSPSEQAEYESAKAKEVSE